MAICIDGTPFPTPIDGPQGMTLRDWFAGQALAGLMTNVDCTNAENAARYAYRFADAMLKERDK